MPVLIDVRYVPESVRKNGEMRNRSDEKACRFVCSKHFVVRDLKVEQPTVMSSLAAEANV